MPSPYRDPPPSLDCPRCRVKLVEDELGLASCAACKGVWLPQKVIKASFGEEWPQGPSLWWHSRLPCPQCVRNADGRPSGPLSARNVNGTIVDRCTRHGLWLDHGELGRLLAAPGMEALGDVAAVRDLHERILAMELSSVSPPSPAGAEAAGPGRDPSLRTTLESLIEKLELQLAEKRAELSRLEDELATAKAQLRSL